MNADAFLLTTQYIKQWCGSSTIYQRGVSYFRQGRVIQLEQDPYDGAWNATVSGSDEYQVVVYLMDGEIDATCDCPAYDTYWTCKHIVAVLLEMEQQQPKEPWKQKQGALTRGMGASGSRRDDRVSQMIDSFVNRLDPEKDDKQSYQKQPLTVEYICRAYPMNTSPGNNLFRMELKIGLKRLYVVKDLAKFLQCMEDHSAYYFTSHFTYNPSEHVLLKEDQEVIQILQEIRKQEELYRRQQSYYRSYSSSHEDGRSLLIPPMIADTLFSKLQGRNVWFEGRSNLHFQPYGDEQTFPISFRLEKGASGDFQLDLTSLQSVSYYEPYGWLVHHNTVYKLSPAQQNILNNMYRFLKPAGERAVPIAKQQMGNLISYVIPGLKQIGRMEIAEEVSDQIISPKLTVKVFIEKQEERVLANIEYHYGNIVIDPFRPEATDEMEHGIILMRETEKEREIMKIIENSPLKYNGKECYLAGEEEIYDFLFTTVPQLESQAEIYMTSAVKSLILPAQHAPVTKVDMDAGGHWLEISFDMEGLDRGELKQLLQSVVERKKYYRLPSGAFVSLEDETFQAMNRWFADLQINKAQVKKGILQLPVYRGLQIDELMSGANSHSVKLGKRFRRLIQDLKNPDTLDFALPDTLRATLRDYQQVGFQWLKTMAHYRLGGILADDMGLGKTLQAIAYLLSEKNQDQKERKTSLVVCPASLVYNWKSEFEKFAPELDVVVAYGTPEERSGFLRSGKPDVLITSYPLLRQDLAFYENVEFDSLILDEAQAIKNHLTKTAKTVKQIKAVKRFALSGTPIENSLDELWSIFDAILPGFFPNQHDFRNLAQDRIAQMVRPFILRRVKQEVLKELPEKIETVHVSELSKKQKELYLAYLERIQQETKESLQTEGFQKSRMKILAGLTRLRQLCCHPSLFLENYKGPSGKLEQLMEIIENALENKRRLLVFSQFTSMLEIIRGELDLREIGYFYLDGQTPSKDRLDMTERFNHGEKELFLISLKAGGTGLNLTGADTVILYDLWWNPAVEEQAAGRAHRMGQKNSVQVMRLITRGTIEEKIYQMQQKKKELIEQIIQPGETMLSSLSEDEIREILGI